MLADDRGLNSINARIEKLKAEGEFFNKRLEVQMKSKMKTKIYKKLLRTLNHSKKRPIYPQQSKIYLGLYFKPPLESTYKRIALITDLQEIPTEPLHESKSKNLQLAKDEIENLMDHLSEEMKMIEILKTGYSKNALNSEHSYHKPKGDLAKSTLKNFTSDRRQNNFLKRAIGGVITTDKEERHRNSILATRSEKYLPPYVNLFNK